MDTQGLFDNDTNQMLTTCIFGLSTLISSYVVYNLKDRIQEDNLQHLALFSEYARKVQQAQEDESTSAADGPPQSLKQRKLARQGGLFQRMELLVRDAIIEADASNPAAVQVEVDGYFSQVLSKTHNEDLRSVRELIKGCYEELACYMLPHPSLDVTRKDYDGNSRVLRDDFKRLLH
jgi:atlastin